MACHNAGRLCTSVGTVLASICKDFGAFRYKRKPPHVVHRDPEIRQIILDCWFMHEIYGLMDARRLRDPCFAMMSQVRSLNRGSQKNATRMNASQNAALPGVLVRGTAISLSRPMTT
jgi:hypothetical protein